jgi:hypothetical protein
METVIRKKMKPGKKYRLPEDKKVDEFMTALVRVHPDSPPCFDEPVDKVATHHSVHDMNRINFAKVEKNRLSAYQQIEDAIEKAVVTRKITKVLDGQLVDVYQEFPDYATRVVASRAKLALCGADPREKTMIQINNNTGEVKVKLQDLYLSVANMDTNDEEAIIAQLNDVRDLQLKGEVGVEFNDSVPRGTGDVIDAEFSEK